MENPEVTSDSGGFNLPKSGCGGRENGSWCEIKLLMENLISRQQALKAQMVEVEAMVAAMASG